MLFFISNLLFYFQVDVIDAEYENLLHAMNSSDDFKTVLQSHKQFLSAITKMSLVALNTPDNLLHFNYIVLG